MPIQATGGLGRDLGPLVFVDEGVTVADLFVFAALLQLRSVPVARAGVFEVVDDLLDDVDVLGVDVVHGGFGVHIIAFYYHS